MSATAPGGRFFDGMYREADDDIRRAAREQLRRGADFIKVMTTGPRRVELEDPDPAQLTRSEIAALVEEAHRQGYRLAAHAEGIAGTELAIEAGIDTIEHGMYLGQRPDLLQRMAAARPVSWSPPVTTGHHSGGLDEHVGTVRGKLADLIVIDGDPLLCPELLSDRERIWLVIQRGEPVAGTAQESA